MNRDSFDLSVYLVTNADMIPEGLTFLDQIKAAIDNGITCIQLREKNLDTRDFIERASQVHELTKKAGIPLIINDRLDVALAVDAEGLHVGQDDMPVPLARKLFGDDKIIGVSTSIPEDVEQAIEDGADYIGIGIIFDTATKITKKMAMGPIGAQKLLQVIKDGKDTGNSNAKRIKTCVIGGVNHSNIQRVRYCTSIPGVPLDGAAVVSCIMAEKDAAKATRDLVSLWNTLPPWIGKRSNHSLDASKPLIHHITNDVVKNFSANVTLAAGGSPIMSECPKEFDDFAKIPGCCLVLNTGTPTEEQVEMYIEAVKAYNKYGNHIVYDPVGVGASSLRESVAKKLLVEGYMTVIKGNESEICALAGYQGKMRGVDSCMGDTKINIVDVAKTLARRTRSIVVVTGSVDLVVDGAFNLEFVYDESTTSQRTVSIEGGDKMMGQITGSGCALGSVIATSICNGEDDKFSAVVKAVRYYKAAGSLAAKKACGPGSFQVEFIDSLCSYKLENY